MRAELAQIKELARFGVPLGGQQIELQQIDHVEGGMSLLRIRIREDHPDWRFGFWGARDSGEWCRHIGHERVGTGY